MSEFFFPGNDYETPERQATAFASRFPSLYFAWRVLNIIRHDGNLAKAGKYQGKEWCEGSLGTIKALEQCGVRIHVTGMNAIDAVEGPCIFIANHMSTLETFVLPGFIQQRKPVTFVVKESLLKYPWFGSVLASRDPIIVSRNNPRKDLTAVLEGGMERLSNGTSIIVFPQSTRNTTLDPSQFNSIGIKLAKRANVPVIPVALCTQAWLSGKLIKDYGGLCPDRPVRFAFGQPLSISGNGKAEHAEVIDFISDHLKLWSMPQ